MQLIDILLVQKKEAPIETYDWYNMMFAHASIFILTSVACVDYQLSVNYCESLKNRGVFPLSNIRASRKNIRKIKIRNVYHRFMLFLSHQKNS